MGLTCEWMPVTFTVHSREDRKCGVSEKHGTATGVWNTARINHTLEYRTLQSDLVTLLLRPEYRHLDVHLITIRSNRSYRLEQPQGDEWTPVNIVSQPGTKEDNVQTLYHATLGDT
ncbi:hypothetical protein A7U60_g2840 [Sanghuangporus baumii]|uniref:Uncharacterized protein n=1 Tax=Sanghuangporus baumii TaxID=108892 RepID=A0A9Q5I1U6_SANBA|nr:hypothetical protein A7U60_g2840 [Sanghuangporus baumii]